MPLDQGGAGASRTGLGIGLMLGSVLLFSLNDVMGKWLVASYAVGQLLVLRSLASLVVLAPLAWRAWRAAPVLERPRLQALRVGFGALESACFYWAVGHLPLADTLTYWMAAPIYVAALGALLLRERVGARRWALILLGFLGVVVALGAELQGAVLPVAVAMVGALLYAAFLLTTRQLRETPDVLLATLQMSGGLAVGLAMLAFQEWRAPGLADLAMLLLLGVISTLGHVGVTRSLKLAPAAVVVPFQYSFLLWAALFGWLVFGDVPGPEMALGAALIMAAGFLLVRLERRG